MNNPLALDALLASAHHLAIFGLFATLIVEMVMLRAPALASAGEAGVAQIRRLARVDSLYGLSAMAVLGFGLARVFWGVKGSAYYLHNGLFHLKFALFIAIGLMSILPTVRFLQWRKRQEADPRFVPAADAIARLRRLVHFELLAFAAIPVVAAYLARGYGM
ncbi:DUF2214 family protein [Niveibacterium sp. SC-1]|uniref:DUF2214 family protein n=1 Tax=Niveibacterium sp. SC-1 TaxID=3135646 RepID=UPI00311F5467